MDYIFGYGSLLSAYSREHYSNIRSSVTTATVSGWSRSWCAVYPDEGATYAGATPDSSKHLDGVLIASEINQDLAKRERGYRFTRLKHENLSINCNELDISKNDQIWICESLSIDASCQLNPLPQSYVDTCISGCIESQGMAALTKAGDNAGAMPPETGDEAGGVAGRARSANEEMQAGSETGKSHLSLPPLPHGRHPYCCCLCHQGDAWNPR